MRGSLPFITDADLDLIVYTYALPWSLTSYSEIIEYVVVDTVDEGGGGPFTLHYKPGSLPDTATPETRAVRYPHYYAAGHSVSSYQPDKFLADVAQWIASDD